MRLWDSTSRAARFRERQAALVAGAQARAMLERMRRQCRNWTEVARTIRDDGGLDHLVRSQALNLVLPRCAQEEAERWAALNELDYVLARAERKAHDALATCVFSDAAVEWLEVMPDVAPTVREWAIWLVREIGDEAARLNLQAWLTVRAPDESQSGYALALRAAEAASQRRPNDGSILTTLGAAQYRCEQYEEAVKTLERSGELNGWLPEDSLFLAMASEELGQWAQAERALAKAEQRCNDDLWDWRDFHPNRTLFDEAENLVRGYRSRLR